MRKPNIDIHKKDIIDMYKAMGEPIIDRDVLMKIRQKYPYGLLSLKCILMNYLTFK